MTKLTQLISALCPNGVPFVRLGEAFDIKNGYTPSKANNAYWEGGTIPWFRMEDIRESGRILSDSIQHITPLAVKGNLFPANTIIIATSATIGEHALLLCEGLANQRFTALMVNDKYRSQINIRYFFHYCFILDEWCKQNLTLGHFPSVDIAQLKSVKFPLPPLPIQEEIVRILDTFAELTARKKQYEYYRDLLLTFGEYEETSLTDRQTDRQTGKMGDVGGGGESSEGYPID